MHSWWGGGGGELKGGDRDLSHAHRIQDRNDKACCSPQQYCGGNCEGLSPNHPHGENTYTHSVETGEYYSNQHYYRNRHIVTNNEHGGDSVTIIRTWEQILL